MALFGILGAHRVADLVLDESTAHARAAFALDPEIDTIFEIGGQDSKYMRTQDGRIADANMNYVCAAGTGSFLEEQADHLGVAIVDETVQQVAQDEAGVSALHMESGQKMTADLFVDCTGFAGLLIEQKLGIRIQIVRLASWDEVLEKARTRESEMCGCLS